MGLLTIILITAVVTIVGGGLGYFLFMRTSAKKIAWTAFCFQLGEGVRDAKVDARSGKSLSELKLQDLRPYMKDVLVRIDKPHARTVHKLERLNMTTNAVNADMVDVWSAQDKYVHVLVHGDTATILKKGYDKETGNIIFQPMPRERMDLIKSEILIKKDRLKREKDILQAITPWIVAGICILGLVTITYFITNSHLKASDVQAAADKYSADQALKAAETYRNAISSLTQEVNKANIVLASPLVQNAPEIPVPPVPPLLESETPQPSGNASLGVQ